MDLGEGGAWPVVLADYIDRALSFWHEHRTLAVPSLLVFAVLLAHILRRPKRQHRRPASPATEEKAAWFNEKEVGAQTQAVGNTSDARSATARKQVRPVAARVISGRKPPGKNNTQAEGGEPVIKPLIFYCSLTGTTERLSKEVAEKLQQLSTVTDRVLPPQVHDLSYVELDDYFISGPRISPQDQPTRYFYILLIPSYDIDTIITNFLAHLDETHNDFRIDTAPLSVLAGYSVFGVGDKEGWPTEEKGFCSQAVEVDKWMAKLTHRKRAYPLGMGDVKSDVNAALDEWCSGLTATLTDLASTGTLGEGVPGSGNPVESDVEDEDEFPDNDRQKRQKRTQATDLEDVGGKKKRNTSLAVDFTTTSNTTSNTMALKPMVPTSSPTYAALTKQGYTIIGTHSGVKICRWTKSALRGRGSCYKNSFYGIASHLCMETTPSLSCSNKCVFCWRHGTNPVSTTWRWEVDPPELIFEGAKRGHYQKIKMLKGVPGVRAERFQEAMRIRHCALSLVGEPIFYPHINKFLSLLHNEHISSFLVCNAQHPQQLQDLHRVTQLYVSIDASNRESLRRIDRPLHRDFWERFNSCLDILKEKRYEQRTVFRLTLVKGFNVDDEVEGYARLVEQGLPCFVEIKGVTYCGTSSAAGAGLTMQNVPFYEEVVAFTEALNKALEKRGLEYGIAAEHAHSCCILLASKRFYKDEKWHTRIDYQRFFELLDRERATGQGFAPEDYCAETPAWALWGMGGFDPRDERVDRKGRPKNVVIAGVAAGEGDVAEEKLVEEAVEVLEHEVIEERISLKKKESTREPDESDTVKLKSGGSAKQIDF